MKRHHITHSLKLITSAAIVACACGGAEHPQPTTSSPERLGDMLAAASTIELSRSAGGAAPRRNGSIVKPERVEQMLRAVGMDQTAPKSACLRCVPDVSLTVKDAKTATLGIVELFCSGDSSQTIFRVAGSADCRTIKPADARTIAALAEEAAP